MNDANEFEIDLIALIRHLWKNALLIILVALLAGSAAFGYTAFFVEPQYQATASMYVNNSSFSLGSTNFSVSSSDLSASNSLVSVYLYILESRTTLEEVIREADLSYTPDELMKMISTKSVLKTGAFEVTVTSTNPAEVELIANSIAKILPERIAEIVDGTTVRIVDYAIIPSQRSGPSIVKNMAIGVLIGGSESNHSGTFAEDVARSVILFQRQHTLLLQPLRQRFVQELYVDFTIYGTQHFDLSNNVLSFLFRQ